MLVTNNLPRSLSAESYRSLRTSIKYCSIDKGLKTIVVTSSVPGEGKSTVAGNLAIILSEGGNRVLLVDCDLRKPTIHKKFEISNKKGLTELLIQERELKEVIQRIDERLSVLPAGDTPPNPSEILGSKVMEDFIKNMEINYDYIILDTPPLLSVTDPQLLAGKASGTLLVVRAQQTRAKLVVKAYKELEKVKANVIGSVLNARERNNIDSYANYYKEDKKKKRKRKK